MPGCRWSERASSVRDGSLGIVVLGAGRIGQMHARNVAQRRDAELVSVADIVIEAARALATELGSRATDDPYAALAGPEVDAVIVATSTDTHVDLIKAAAAAGKAIFAEKPIDLDLDRAREAVAAVQSNGVPFFPGLNRRFDPSFRALHTRIRAGEIGKVELVTITSRDPEPPPLDYLKRSGGMFRDMSIHDFDVARWLLDEEPVQLQVMASNLVDPAIGAAGDVDTALITMRAASGALCVISNSRRAAYGYDQRVEVLGEGGVLMAGNVPRTTVSSWTERGVSADPPQAFFLERYAESYRAELEHFVDAVLTGSELLEGPEDGIRALVLAEAAVESLRTGRAVDVP